MPEAPPVADSVALPPPTEALAVVEDNAWVSMKVAEIFIYLTAIFGLGVLGLSDKGASTLASVGFIFFLAGRFIGAGLLKKFPAHKVLGDRKSVV